MTADFGGRTGAARVGAGEKLDVDGGSGA